MSTKTNNKHGATSKLHVFDSKKDADDFLNQLSKNTINNSAPESARDEVSPTYEVGIDNSNGTTIKQWVGARMEQNGDPRVYVDVTIGPVHPRDQMIHKDVCGLGIYVNKYSFYYQWWNGQRWIYVPDALQGQAPPGHYYPAIGIQWTPAGRIVNVNSEQIISNHKLAVFEAYQFEDTKPPKPKKIKGMPEPGNSGTNIKPVTAGTLASAYAAYNDRCVGGDDQGNNCAHFLSDAFIRGGFTELLPNNPHINARCSTSAKRPVRARDMWSWFQSKAVRTSRKVERNTGIWATFQLKENVYWGGHVIIIDTNRWQYVGRPAYWDWDQYLYQW